MAYLLVLGVGPLAGTFGWPLSGGSNDRSGVLCKSLHRGRDRPSGGQRQTLVHLEVCSTPARVCELGVHDGTCGQALNKPQELKSLWARRSCRRSSIDGDMPVHCHRPAIRRRQG